jgi:hypothetical protein
MKTTNKILLALLILILAAATVLLIYIRTQISETVLIEGSGNVVTEQREILPFTAVEVSGNIHLTLNHGPENSLQISGDDRLINMVVSKVEDETLKIYTNQSGIRHYRFDATLAFDLLESINASAGAHISNADTIFAEHIQHRISAGAFSNLVILADEISVKASSGSHADLSGKTNSLVLESSAGSEIKAYGLEAAHVEARTSAGANASVFATEHIQARANSGSEINYKGNPPSKDISTSSGGNVSAR